MTHTKITPPSVGDTIYILDEPFKVVLITQNTYVAENSKGEQIVIDSIHN